MALPTSRLSLKVSLRMPLRNPTYVTEVLRSTIQRRTAWLYLLSMRMAMATSLISGMTSYT